MKHGEYELVAAKVKRYTFNNVISNSRISHMPLCITVNFKSSSDALFWSHFVKIDSHKLFVSLITDKSKKEMQEAIDSHKELENRIFSNTILKITRENVFDSFNSSDKV